MPSNNDRLFAAAIYIISFFTVFVGPLVIWIIKRDSPYVNYHGKEYFNFFITYVIYSTISCLLMLVLIGFITIWIVGLLYFVFTIIAAIKAFEGSTYRIPFIIRFIR
ncbi:DUF4870 domain-containing protein [Robertmurraya yapensis]|uniref:DUF4870 domain-containing protein n=2 Tax=Bacillaceae TaxID=186817 RepID=A0A3S0IAC2_9BACI|nr:DUF4870 domain-containing protein [Bacillus yapensis]RTR31043.1 DUF4870 domain-containing protein [Bacillus yapensis]TKS95472.1 DUF4870 domain-containing protein [Bacillus yapensis]